MIQNYQDAMAICKWVGYPNVFITVMCNPNWPKIRRFMDSRNLKFEDRLNIITRVFKMKLMELMKDLTSTKIFGKVKAGIYLIRLNSFITFSSLFFCSRSITAYS